MAAGPKDSVLQLREIVTRFGKKEVHSGVSFDVPKGKILALIGGSGSGKSTLLREMIGLLRPTSGRVIFFGQDIWGRDYPLSEEVRARFGVLFQDGALFSALSAGENIAVPLVERAKLPPKIVREIVDLRLALTGLDSATAQLMPSELSGGMRKRVGLARALSLEPELVFLDEPTSGLDPISARAFDILVRTLCDSLGLTMVVISHDLESIRRIADDIVVLANGKVLTQGTFAEVSTFDDPWVRDYFSTGEPSPA